MPAHLSIPFGYDATGSAAVLEQDTTEEIAQCVRVLLSTPTGTRIEQFDYGIPDPTFSDDSTMVATITQAVQRWEPRATGVQVGIVPNGDGSVSITAQLPGVHR